MHTPSMSYTRTIIASAAVLLCSAGLSSSGAAQLPRRAGFDTITAMYPSDGALREYIMSVHFLTDHVSGDERMLDPTHPNIIVRIEPAVGNHLLNDAQLKTGGRIVARLVNRSADSVSRFALAPRGRTYVWVQNTGGSWRGVLISTDSTGNILRRSPFRVRPDSLDHPVTVRQALARWGTDSTGTAMTTCWPVCVRGAWCKGDTTGTAVW